MVGISAGDLLKTLDELYRWETIATDWLRDGRGEDLVPVKTYADVFNKLLMGIQDHAERLELKESAKRVANQASVRLLMQGPPCWRVSAEEFRFIREIVVSELSESVLFYVPLNRRHVFENFWGQILDAFPVMKLDGLQAIHCYAYELDTACVFHCVRVAEHGLRIIARRLHVKLTHAHKHQPLETASWNKVIEGLKKRIESLRALPQSKARARSLVFFSTAADHCLYMKESRNSVSHTGEPYIEGDALAALQRVRLFVSLLSENLRT